MYALRPDRENDPDFGPRYLFHVGKQSFGFADYYYSPAEGIPDQRFTMVFLGPAGHYNVPFRAAACVLLTAITTLVLIGALALARRKRRHPASRPSPPPC